MQMSTSLCPAEESTLQLATSDIHLPENPNDRRLDLQGAIALVALGLVVGQAALVMGRSVDRTLADSTADWISWSLRWPSGTTP